MSTTHDQMTNEPQGTPSTGTSMESNDQTRPGATANEGHYPQPTSNLQLQASDLISLVDTAIKRRLEPVVQEMQLAKRPRKSYSFRYQGNEHQHKFNEDIRDQVCKAISLLESEESLSASSIMRKTEKQLDKRNKLIRVADSSDCGWKTVEEYEDKGIGSDSDDEKKIRAAEDRARRKKRDGGSKGNTRSRLPDGNFGFHGFTEGFNQPFRNNGGPSTVPPLLSAPLWSDQGTRFQQPNLNYYANQSGYAFKEQPQRKNIQTGNRGSCFNCGSFDHWYQRCPVPKKN